MTTGDRIQQYLQRLPKRLQDEVLDFVEFLLAKAELKDAARDENEWSSISLSFAMREMEDEATPEYSESDLRESFT